MLAFGLTCSLVDVVQLETTWLLREVRLSVYKSAQTTTRSWDKQDCGSEEFNVTECRMRDRRARAMPCATVSEIEVRLAK